MKRFLILALGLLLAAAVVAGEASGPQLEPGAKAPSFTLKGTDGKTHSLDQVKGAKGTVVVFTCNHCPFAKGYEDRLIALAKEYQAKGFGFVAINPNDPAVAPDDNFDKMVVRAKEKNLPYPYLVDATQEIAKAYGAQVTPHVFLLDGEGSVTYRGRVDDSVKEPEVQSRDLKDALDAMAAGKPVPRPTTKAFGCSVKWKKAA
jgi:peroxiredoxin